MRIRLDLPIPFAPVAADGFVYERQAIVDWFARPVKGGVLSPATGAPLEDLDLAPAPDVLERVRALAV